MNHIRRLKVLLRLQQIEEHSNSGWKDNYEAIVQSNKVNSKIYDKFSSVVKKYSDTYKIVEDLQVVGDYEEAGDDYSLLIFLYSQDSDINENIIKELDAFVKDYEELYLSYGLFITKDLDFYNKLINEDISKLNTIYTGTSGQTSPEDLFEHVKYDYERITYNHDGYSKKVFINNGNKSDDEYKNPKEFNNILFYYQSERNSFVGANSTDFIVFGIN